MRLLYTHTGIIVKGKYALIVTVIANEEYARIKSIAGEFSKLRDTLLKRIHEDISSGDCGADKLIDELFSVGKVQDINDTIIQRARTRIELGNPPGKKNSLGDAIHWEFLLENVCNGEDLHMISGDGDFDSELNKGNLAEFLCQEWADRKISNILYYHRLSNFLNSQFTDIKITSDQELAKEFYISIFVNSSSFKVTHAVINELLTYSSYSDSELDEMINASITNEQIYRIKEDSDVHSFLSKLKELKEAKDIPF